MRLLLLIPVFLTLSLAPNRLARSAAKPLSSYQPHYEVLANASAPKYEPWTRAEKLSLAYDLLTGLLVIIGGFGVCFALRTLRAIERQARIMRRQTAHIARQAQSMRYQSTYLKEAAEAAKVSADAAIASERAWVMVSLEKIPITGSLLMYGSSLKGREKVHNASVRVRCTCINQGKTPAKIIEKRATVVRITEDNPLPDTPNLDIGIEDPVPFLLQAYPGPGQIVDLRLDTEYKISEGERDMTSFFVVYGVVKYQHLFSEQIVQTTFGYKIRLDSILERLIEHPEYNKNT